MLARVLLVIVLGAAPALAESGPTAVELQAHGEELAKGGRYADAIAEFKAADRIEPNATHKCLVALAYTRRELWPQAEIFIARCHVLATTEPLPEWVPVVDKLIEERIGQATVAEVQITIDPAGTPAELSVSSFLPDETFTPATQIHLTPGHHVITATAPGFETEHHAIDVTGKAPTHVAIRMYRTGTRPKPPSPLPRAMLIAGVATLGAGAIAYGVMGVGWLELRSRDQNNFGGTYQTMYEYARPISLSLFAIGAGLAIGGLVLRPSHPAESPTAAFAPLPGGGVVAVQWQR
jgi:hypothetical protein